ncbi:hypothetical protein SARC_11888, partial [Sphaeroforma arctica JP610]
VTPIMPDLSFKPNSLCSKFGYVVAGGQRSQLVVKNLVGGRSHTVSLGGSINNSMGMYRTDTGIRLLVSNNDESVKVYSLSGMDHIVDIAIPFAVNNTAVSPDNRTMLVVGDSKVGLFYDIRGGTYTRTTSFNACQNAAFSCNWNYAGDKVAVACQDGSIAVWDMKYLSKPLTSISSSQSPNTSGACRGVKFSHSSSMDLLVFTEHESLVHVVDTRAYVEKQTLRPSPDLTQGVAGVTFSSDAKKLFVAMECGVYEYAIDTMQRRRFAAGGLL